MQDENTDTSEASDRNTMTFDSPDERREFWLAVVQEQVESGLSANAFCKQQGLSPSSFHHWKQKTKKLPKPDETSETPVAYAKEIAEKIALESAPRFAELKISDAVPVTINNRSIEIRRGDFHITLQPSCDRALLHDLLSMLGEIPC